MLSDLPINGDWAITIVPNYRYGLDDWAYHYADGTNVFLHMTTSVTICSRG